MLKTKNVLGALRAAIVNNRGEGFVDSAVKILIGVVIGALLLTGLFTLFSDIVLVQLTQRITSMFNFGTP
ncbi:MAG: hypothetical protein COA82_12075 [Alkaliphilus sp.]|nr:hypothetical protein [bacterium AH-315-G05]PHS29896.1 MAG: hypothetical protein COA82_12075 [Alkaliphilus sp.]